MTDMTEEIYTPRVLTRTERDLKADQTYTERDHALYDAIIVDELPTVRSTLQVDDYGYDDEKGHTFEEFGLPEKDN